MKHIMFLNTKKIAFLFKKSMPFLGHLHKGIPFPEANWKL